MKQVMMIKFDSLKWRMIDEYKVANPFIEVGFRQVKDVVDLRVFDLLNISRINNNRAEEMLLCIYHLLQPDRRIDEGKECEAVKKSKKLLKFVLDDGTGTDRVILSGIHEYYEPEELVGKTCIAITNLPPRPMMGIDSCGMLISAVHHENGEEKLHLLMVDPHIPAGAKLY